MINLSTCEVKGKKKTKKKGKKKDAKLEKRFLEKIILNGHSNVKNRFAPSVKN